MENRTTASQTVMTKKINFLHNLPPFSPHPPSPFSRQSSLASPSQSSGYCESKHEKKELSFIILVQLARHCVRIVSRVFPLDGRFPFASISGFCFTVVVHRVSGTLSCRRPGRDASTSDVAVQSSFSFGCIRKLAFVTEGLSQFRVKFLFYMVAIDKVI